MKNVRSASWWCILGFAMSAGAAAAAAQSQVASPPPPPLIPIPGTAQSAADFAKIDHDGNGYVDPLEVVVSSHARSGAPGLNTDFDRDGKSTLLELLASHAQWARGLDFDRDGRVSKVEFDAGQEHQRMVDEGITAKFKAADTNSDGVIDAAEIKMQSRMNYDAVNSLMKSSKRGAVAHEIAIKGKVATAADYHAHHTSVLASADSDKDGRISHSEYVQWSKGATR